MARALPLFQARDGEVRTGNTISKATDFPPDTRLVGWLGIPDLNAHFVLERVGGVLTNKSRFRSLVANAFTACKSENGFFFGGGGVRAMRGLGESSFVYQTPHPHRDPPNRQPAFADFANLFCQFVGFLGSLQ